MIMDKYKIKRHYKIFCVNGNTGFRNEMCIRDRYGPEPQPVKFEQILQ